MGHDSLLFELKGRYRVKYFHVMVMEMAGCMLVLFMYV